MDANGWGPRASIDYAAGKHTTVHAGGAITTNLPNLWQDNFVTGGFPLVFNPVVTALPNVPVPFSAGVVPLTLPAPYTTAGEPLLFSGSSPEVSGDTSHYPPKIPNQLPPLTPRP